MDLSKIWIVQGAAARKTEDHYGTQQALEYLVGDKFFNFLEAAHVAHLNHTSPVSHHRRSSARTESQIALSVREASSGHGCQESGQDFIGYQVLSVGQGRLSTQCLDQHSRQVEIVAKWNDRVVRLWIDGLKQRLQSVRATVNFADCDSSAYCFSCFSD
jgi:hypothetical protein